MAIDNFLTLLDNVLSGDDDAITQWVWHSRKKSFNEEEIDQTFFRLNYTEESKNKLYLQALWIEIGIGYGRDENKAAELYELGIKLGDARAMNARANMYVNGLGGDVNYLKAIELYEQGIGLGNAESMTLRANMHQKGQGGDVNYEKAIELYAQAIELGNENADMLLNELCSELGNRDMFLAQLKLSNVLSQKEQSQDNNNLTQSNSDPMNISMQILGGFMAVVGCAAVAVAFVALNAATFGAVGLVVASVGVASLLLGVGFFATGTYKKNQTPDCDIATSQAYQEI